VRTYVGDLLADRHAGRIVAFSERLAAPADDVRFPVPVIGELALSGTGRTVCLRGQVRTVAGLVCGACLRWFEEPLDVEVSEEFSRPSPDGATAPGEQALGPDDFLMPIEPDDTVDLTEVVRQHLILALPIAPRCSPDCRGLCPRCGADRNAGPCGCEIEEIDPRLQVLRGWSPEEEGPPPGGEKRRTRTRPAPERRATDKGE